MHFVQLSNFSLYGICQGGLQGQSPIAMQYHLIQPQQQVCSFPFCVLCLTCLALQGQYHPGQQHPRGPAPPQVMQPGATPFNPGQFYQPPHSAAHAQVCHISSLDKFRVIFSAPAAAATADDLPTAWPRHVQ